MNQIKMLQEKVTSDAAIQLNMAGDIPYFCSQLLVQIIDEECNSPEIISNAVFDSVEDVEFDFEENSEIFMNQITANTIGKVVYINVTLIEEEGCQSEKEEDDENTHHVKQADLVNAMKFVMDNIVAKTEDEFETLEAFSKLYTSRRDEMISNRVNQTTINSYFSK